MVVRVEGPKVPIRVLPFFAPHTRIVNFSRGDLRTKQRSFYTDYGRPLRKEIEMSTVLQKLDELEQMVNQIRRKIGEIQSDTILELDHKAQTYEQIEVVREKVYVIADLVYNAHQDRTAKCSGEELRATPQIQV